MGKAKKKENLTLEERLQAALVPDWEQPYKIPKNWCWTRIANLCCLSNGKAFKPTDWAETGIPIVRIQNLNNPEAEYNLYSGMVKDKFRLCGGELLFAWSGTPGTSFGAHIWWGNEAVLNQHIFRVDFDERHINKIYFKYAINQQLDMLISVAHGGAGLQHVTKGVFETTPIPLPPLPEQQRIVDRIQSLFTKLDEAKKKAQDALDSFETRKAAILQKAFTGELTAKWRKEHGVGMESWDKTILKNVCKVNPKKIDTNGLPDDLEVSFFPMASLSETYGEITEPQTRLLKDVKNGFTNFSEGDVVFAKITPCMENGKSAIIGKLVNGIGYGTTEFYVLRCNENLYNRYLYHMVRDTSFRNKAKAVMSGAVGQQRVPKSFMENYSINLPSVLEQTEIVRILDDLLAKEQQAKESAKTLLEQINLIKKSILARAFRGELGTNDSAEESAVELVKEVVEKSAEINNKGKTKTKRTVIPGKIKSALSNSNEEEIVRLLIKSIPKAVSLQMIMSISKKKFELMDALRSLEQKQIVIKNSLGEYLLKR